VAEAEDHLEVLAEADQEEVEEAKITH